VAGGGATVAKEDVAGATIAGGRPWREGGLAKAARVGAAVVAAGHKGAAE
jgi:hypothetical protein